MILMSGVVNRAVAEKAFAVKADELLRKPFQPQDLITRVKHLLKPNGHPAPTPAAAASAAAALSTIFSSASAPQQARPAPAARSSFAGAAVEIPSHTVPVSAPRISSPATQAPQLPAPALVPTQFAAPKAQGNGDAAKMKIEILRLEGLVKKLQSELVAEREYSRALEEHIKTLQEAE